LFIRVAQTLDNEMSVFSAGDPFFKRRMTRARHRLEYMSYAIVLENHAHVAVWRAGRPLYGLTLRRTRALKNQIAFAQFGLRPRRHAQERQSQTTHAKNRPAPENPSPHSVSPFSIGWLSRRLYGSEI
jgi:hypothetical protein